MKKIQLLVLILSIIPICNTWSQAVINLDSINGQNVNGEQIQFTATQPSTPNHMYDFYITNNSTSSQNWMVTRKNIIQPNDWSNYLCWGGLCYTPSPLEEWNSNTTIIEVGETKELRTYCKSPTEGMAHYRYYISTDGINFIDSVDIVVTTSLSTSTNESNSLQFNLYPNPAKNNLHIDVNKPNMNLMIYNASGHLMFSKKINQVSNDINISNLNNGYYFYVIEDLDSHIIKSDKIIILK